MSTKPQLCLACIIALFVMLAVNGQQAFGIAAIQTERQHGELLLNLTFRDLNGASTPPTMQTPPTFAIIDTAGKAVFNGKFEFG